MYKCTNCQIGSLQASELYAPSEHDFRRLLEKDFNSKFCPQLVISKALCNGCKGSRCWPVLDYVLNLARMVKKAREKIRFLAKDGNYLQVNSSSRCCQVCMQTKGRKNLYIVREFLPKSAISAEMQESNLLENAICGDCLGNVNPMVRRFRRRPFDVLNFDFALKQLEKLKTSLKRVKAPPEPEFFGESIFAQAARMAQAS